MQLLRLLANDVRSEITVGAGLVPVVRHALRHIEHDSHWQAMELARDFHEWLARSRLHVRSVHYRQFARREPLAGDEMEQFKSVLRRRLWLFSSSDTRPR